MERIAPGETSGKIMRGEPQVFSENRWYASAGPKVFPASHSENKAVRSLLYLTHWREGIGEGHNQCKDEEDAHLGPISLLISSGFFHPSTTWQPGALEKLPQSGQHRL